MTSKSDLRHVIDNLRKDDLRELSATTYVFDPPAYTDKIWNAGVFQVFYAKDEPAGVCGWVPLWPGVVSLFAFGTDRWPEVAIGVTKYIRRFMMPTLAATRVHRAQALALADREDVDFFLRSFDPTLVTEFPKFGGSGEDFRLYTWLREPLHGNL